MAARPKSRAPRRRGCLAQTCDVRFDTNVATDLPITFTPKQPSETLQSAKPGWRSSMCRNNSNAQRHRARDLQRHAHMSAGQYFNKLECFCFQDRVYRRRAGSGPAGGLFRAIRISPAIRKPRGLDTLTLSYTYFRSVNAGPTG